jgi:hypothetical protein
MNLVGKIFIVLVFVMSLVFCTMSMQVFQTQTIWRDTVVNTDTTGGKTMGLRQQLADKEVERKDAADAKTALQNTLDKERAR